MALLPHSLSRPQGLIEVDTVLEIGAGLRPIDWYKPKRHICVEPFGPYADRLEAAGYNTWRTTAREALENYSCENPPVDAIYMLDVIEHMDKAEGQEVLAMAQALKPKQIVVFTPHGFLPQEGDAWGLGGEEWQRHRSGWYPFEFPGWTIEPWSLGHKAFFASWQP